MLRQQEAPARRSSAWNRGLIVIAAGLMAAGIIGLTAPNHAPAQLFTPSASDEPLASLPLPSDPKLTARAVILFQAERDPVSLVSGQRPPISDAAWNIFCRTQVALIKSSWLMQSALRDP